MKYAEWLLILISLIILSLAFNIRVNIEKQKRTINQLEELVRQVSRDQNSLLEHIVILREKTEEYKPVTLN